MKKKNSDFITGIALTLLGGVGLYFSILDIFIYFQTGEISFQLKPTMPRFFGKEALMMEVALSIVWLMIIFLGYTDIRKKWAKKPNKNEETNNLP
jgi:uncharacterized membrane protein